MIKRVIMTKLVDFINIPSINKDVLLVEGARQVGKTTIIETVLNTHFNNRSKICINLEKDPLTRKQIDNCNSFQEFHDLLEDNFNFDHTSDSIIFIDEAQESRQLGKFVRFMKEDWEKTSVILTGSSLTRLFDKKIRYPVGRVRYLTIYPFSFSEYLEATTKKSLIKAIKDPISISNIRHQTLLEELNRFMKIGGMPEVVISELENGNGHQVRSKLIAGFEQDFHRLFDEEEIHLIVPCFKSVANFVGSPSKNTTVYPNANNSVNEKIKNVFARLEEWRFILNSSQTTGCPEKQHNFYPKRYLFDTGILREYRELGVPDISICETINSTERAPLGSILENQVAIEISRIQKKLTGWKLSPQSAEIDFLLEYNDTIIPIECKATLRWKRNNIRGIISYLKRYKVKTGFIVSFAPFEIIKEEQDLEVINIPLYALDTYLKSHFV